MLNSKIWKGMAVLGLLLFSGATYAKVAAKFESVSGLVQFREKNGKWQNAALSTSLSPNTELQTGPNGKATLIFPNGTKVMLKPGTLVSLDQYTSGSYGTQTNMSLRVGRMSADIAKVNDANARNHFRVRTPTVVAGVRGSGADFSNGYATQIHMREHSIDTVDRSGQSSRTPEGGSMKATRQETTTADKMAAKDGTVTMVASEAATAGEAEMAFTSGDFLFSTNASDFMDFADFLDFFDYIDFLSEQVTFEKL